MIIKSGASGGQLEVADMPKITYSGDWMPWRPEFYGGVLYWEAWLLSSGTLVVEEGSSYVGDAWGIGGGSQAGWTSGGGSLRNCGAGIPNMRTGLTFAGSISATIGEGGLNGDSSRPGNATKLGDMLTCAGGADPDAENSVSDSYKRYRFEDPDKASEAGRNVTANDDGTTFTAQGGWLRINRTIRKSYSGIYNTAVTAQGEGFGGAGCYMGWSAPGALVIRIPA